MKSRLHLFATIFTMLTLALAPSAQAQHTIFAIENVTGNLLRFNSATPGTIDASVAITGLQAGESITEIDFRPATGQLYGIGTGGAAGSRLYIIDVLTGVATQVGVDGGFFITDATNRGMDFNPVADRIRLVDDVGDVNLRVNPNDGTLAGTDTNLAYDAADVNTGVNPTVRAVAYTNNFAGTATTTLYGIDATLDVLVRVGSVGGAPTSPNSGLLFTVGALGFDLQNSSFDIAPDGTAYATVGGIANDLYTIDLATGAATQIGVIGSGQAILGIAVAAPPPVCPPLQSLYGAAHIGANQGGNEQSLFFSINPGTGAAALIGAVGFEQVSGMAFRRSDNTLFAIGERADGSNTAVLITIDPCTGIGTEVGPTGTGRAQDISFNPVDGVLFGTVAFDIFTFDTGTGAGTLVGTTGTFGAGLGLSFDFSGTLFRANSATLQNIDPATGGVSSSIALDFSASATGKLNAMDAAPLSGTVFGTGPSSTLVTVDTTSGVVTDVGPTQVGLDAIAFTPQPADSLISVLTDDADPVNVGTQVSYTINVGNLGPAIAGPIHVVITFSGAAVTIDSATAGCVIAAPVVTCDFATALDLNTVIGFGVQATPTAGGAIVVDVTATTPQPDPDLTNNTAQEVTGVGSADVSVTKVDAVDPVTHPAAIVYTITVTNNALTAAEVAGGVVVTDTFTGAAVTFGSAVPSQGTCNAALPVVCNLGDIAGMGGFATVVVTVNSAAVGTVTETAVVTTATTDPTPANNTDVETTLVNAIDLAITKTDSPDPMAVGGGNVTYLVTVTNSGNIAATLVALTDNFTFGGGAAATFVSATPSQGTCTPAFPAVPCALGTINAGANATVSIVVTPTVGGTITNTASATATEVDPVPANNTNIVATTLVAASQDFTITVSPNSRTILPGQTATFTVTITPAPFIASLTVDCSHSIPLGGGCPGTLTLNPGNLVATGQFVITTSGFFVAQYRAPNQSAPLYAYWLPATAGFGALGLVLVGANRKRLSGNRRAQFLAILSLLLAITLLAGCPLGRDREDEGTPGGTYSVTFTGTSGAITHSVSANVTVQGTN